VPGAVLGALGVADGFVVVVPDPEAALAMP
jgi:hypothetical protein